MHFLPPLTLGSIKRSCLRISSIFAGNLSLIKCTSSLIEQKIWLKLLLFRKFKCETNLLAYFTFCNIGSNDRVSIFPNDYSRNLFMRWCTSTLSHYFRNMSRTEHSLAFEFCDFFQDHVKILTQLVFSWKYYKVFVFGTSWRDFGANPYYSPSMTFMPSYYGFFMILIASCNSSFIWTVCDFDGIIHFHWSFYTFHGITLCHFYYFHGFILFFWTFYDFHAIIVWSFYDFHSIILWRFYDFHGFIFFLWTFYVFIGIMIWPFNHFYGIILWYFCELHGILLSFFMIFMVSYYGSSMISWHANVVFEWPWWHHVMAFLQFWWHQTLSLNFR